MSSHMNQPFSHWLRHALNHLYDPAELRTNPLFRFLGVDQNESPSALRRILVSAIEALRPQADIAPDADTWRSYRVLHHRYVQQFSQVEVATNLGLSLRQTQRLTALALEVLADHLLTQYNVLDADLPADADPAQSESGFPSADGEATPNTDEALTQADADDSILQELSWLERSSLHQPTDVNEVVQGVLQTIRPLAEATRVTTTLRLAAGLPLVSAQADVLRHALLNVLSTAIRFAAHGQVTVATSVHLQQIQVSVQSLWQPTAIAGKPDDERTQSLRIAQELLAHLGGSISLNSEAEGQPLFAVCLTLPMMCPIAVLAIDDNPDALQLFRRYLSTSRYTYTGTRDPEQALALAEELSPQIIVLDVMLPGVDGWELLGRMREHPRTRGTPIIVCTILPQEQLALTLGAADFLRKPVRRADLLAALDRQTESLVQAPG